jgi:hypothetical protein
VWSINAFIYILFMDCITYIFCMYIYMYCSITLTLNTENKRTMLRSCGRRTPVSAFVSVSPFTLQLADPPPASLRPLKRRRTQAEVCTI